MDRCEAEVAQLNALSRWQLEGTAAAQAGVKTVSSEHTNALVAQSTQSEGERGGRRRVEPLNVVDGH
ncbi:MAG TPA: hypothetical protein VF781_03780 [Solirubrobacteraceae bacterium]